MSRYSRFVSLPGFTSEHMDKIRAAEVLVVGAGGLGSPVITYLAGAGVGYMRIIDDDIVEESNLGRQVLFTTRDIGQPKAVVAAERVRAINPDVKVEALVARLKDVADEVVGSASVVMDCSDNLPTRYAINRSVVRLGVPSVWSTIGQYSGSCSVVIPGTACYECAFGPEENRTGWYSAEDQGVFAPTCGVVGALAAGEALKTVTGIGSTLVGRIAVIDLLSTEFSCIPLNNDPSCKACY